MMKNRDTSSNPYRVPKQPTPKWIAVSIAGLFLSNLALIGGFVFLVLPNDRCRPCLVNVTSSKIGAGPGEKAMPRDGTELGVIQDLVEKEKLLPGRLDKMENRLNFIMSRIDDLEEFCKDLSKPSSSPSMPATKSSFYPQEPGLAKVTAQLQVKVSALDTRLSNHIMKSQQLCGARHYHYGTSCFYVVEGKMAQGKAKQLCENIDQVDGVLAMIKNELVREFLLDKLPNRRSAYWIGIERLDSQTEVSTTFQYADGTRVQSDVWENWIPGHRRQDSRHKCVALKYDETEGGWFWKTYNCSERFGYVCQYFAGIQKN